MRHLFGCPDKQNILMARNVFRILIENKPVRGLRKKYNIPDVNWLRNTKAKTRAMEVMVFVSSMRFQAWLNTALRALCT